MKRCLVLSALAGSLLFGCKKDACKDEPPSFQLDVVADDSSAKSVVVELVNGSERRRRTFELGTELLDGRTSIAVEVEPAFVGQVMLNVRTLDGMGGGGAVLQQGSGTFEVMGDGCNRFTVELTDGQPQPDGGQNDAQPGDGDVDGGVDGGADGGQPDGNDLDATDMDALDPEAGQPDAMEDAGEPDLGVDTGPRCNDIVDPDTVALYSMEGDLNDATGGHNGALSGNATFEAGEPTCGNALRISGGNQVQGYGMVPDSADFDLAEGSIDLWLRNTVVPTRALGVLSRDSAGAVTGRFTLYIACDGTVVAKLDDAYRCSAAPVTAGQWTHVGVNFGAAGFELWIDGAIQNRATPVGLIGQNCSQTVNCGDAATGGLAGNDNPWILGASADGSVEGQGSPLSLPFRDGLLDAFRISDVRRSF
jgi:hypothetical protein